MIVAYKNKFIAQICKFSKKFNNGSKMKLNHEVEVKYKNKK